MHLSHNKISTLVATPLALLCFTGAANAQSSVYMDKSMFLLNLASGSYTENFNSLSGGPLAPITFTDGKLGGFKFVASASHGLIPLTGGSGAALSTFDATDALSIVFTGAPVTAIGGNFFNTDVNGNFVSSNVTVNINNGSSVQINLTPTSINDFSGFTTSAGSITSLSIKSTSFIPTAPSTQTYPSLDNFIVGSFSGAPQGGTVPEPGSLAQLAGFGIVGAGFVLKRRKK